MTDHTEDPETAENRCQKVLRAAALQLGEHFDSVHIICTRHHDTVGSKMLTDGEGNWYARYGSAKEWVTKEEEKTRVGVRPSDD